MSPIPYTELPSRTTKSLYSWLPNLFANNTHNRNLLGAVFVVGTAVTLLYYLILPVENNPFSNEYKTAYRKYNKPIDPDRAKPKWTWVCIRDTCERTIATKNITRMSLQTCNALCPSGNTIIWPEPTGPYHTGNKAVPITTDFKLDITKSPSEDISEHLRGAFALFTRDVNKIVIEDKETQPKYSLIVRVIVKEDKDPRLRLNTDESYSLKIAPSKKGFELEATILAKSFSGARHGFETLSQLIWYDPLIQSLMAMETAAVTDKPYFPYRGLLLDTARNFFPVNDILRTLDAMAAAKLNTFHWHATDCQSFPLKLNSTLKHAKYGAYGPREVYTTMNIRKVVHHARLRGIRVVIEIDTPGHIGTAWSWGREEGLDDLAFFFKQASPLEQELYCGDPSCGQLNPNNTNVMTILGDIYKEIIELTGVTDVFHLGGDEVYPNCWAKHMGICESEIYECDTMELWLSFMSNAYKALVSANGGKAPNMTMIWSSSLTKAPYLEKLKKFTIQYWGFDNSDIEMLNTDFHMVASEVRYWYMDCGFGSIQDDGPSHCGPYQRWHLMYDHTLDGSKKWQIKGGEACMWSELVGPTDLDVRMWPRAAAMAERLWTNPNGLSSEKVLFRLDMHRQRLIARGVGAAPLYPRWCSENPLKCS